MSVETTASTGGACRANAPRVSVVMSVYNNASQVGRAIESLLRQTYTDFELILINDGSRDQTAMILEEYRLRDPRIRIITQENAGLTISLIRGCAAARGEYIARQDADDWSMPTRLATQVNILDADPAIGLVSCAAQSVGPSGERLETICHTFDTVGATDKLLNQRIGPPAHGSVTFRRSVYETVGGYRAEFYFGQDSDLWMRMAEVSNVAYSPELLYVFSRDVKTISGQRGQLQRQFGVLGQSCRSARRAGRSDELILRDAKQLTERIGSMKTESSGFSVGGSSMAYLIGSSLAKQRHPNARRYLWLSIRSNPLNWRAWVRLVADTFMRSPCDTTQDTHHE